MRRTFLAGLGLCLGLTACGNGSSGISTRSGAEGGSGSYEASGTVLQNASHGPELCLGGVLTSLPPQCGGVPLVGWDWDTVSNEERAAETIWGDYHVVGTYDGTSLTLTEPPGPSVHEPPSARIGSACPEPEGGWERPRPDQTSEADMLAAAAASGPPSEAAGFWLDDPNPPSGAAEQDFAHVVLNFAFTRDLEGHTAEIRKHWGGALCVSRHEHSMADLEKIRTEAEGFVTQRGLKMLMSDADEVKGVVEIGVVFSDSDDQEAFDQRFGAGVVVLTSALRPAP